MIAGDIKGHLTSLSATDLLDGQPEARFGRLIRLAAATLRAPASMISLVEGDRQLFKSQHESGEPFANECNVPLSYQLCEQVVAGRAPLVVDDTRQHSLLDDGPAAADLRVVAYLGVPLLDEDGCARGALCAFDSEVRHWTDQEVVLLQEFAVLAQAQIQEARTTGLLRAQTLEHERLAVELTAARDDAEAARSAKSQFLATISHELRTPLNAVIGLAGLLVDGQLDGQSRLHAKMLRDAADHLLNLINDLLDFSKLEADRLEFEDAPYSLDKLVQSAVDLMASRAHAKGLEIGAFVATDVPQMLLGDSGRIRQVLLNLLGNAVKFTESGSVMLDLSYRGLVDNNCVLDFAVTDTGIGIAAPDISRLFEEFSQADSSVSRRFGGSGLGLAICRRLVTRMGGDIAVDSALGQGSVFRFTIAQPPVPVPAEYRMRGQARLTGQPILVLHASAAGAELLCRQIVSRGGTAQRAALGIVALRQLRQAQEQGVPVYACVVDQGLPGGGAEAFGRAVRADRHIARTRLVLVGTAESANDAAPSAADLFDTRLLKPVPCDTLIYRLLGPKLSPEGSRALAAQQAPLPQPSLRILVAEDNQTNQAVIRAMLEKLGHRADLAANGLEAVQAIRDRPYDLVLMDVMMPELDGIAATERIRALPGPAGQVPILALTANTGPEQRMLCYKAGIQSVFVKPMTLKTLAAALAEWQFRASDTGTPRI